MLVRILSWNINGLRSFKTNMKQFLDSLEADIICLQETKVTRRFDKVSQVAVVLNIFYCRNKMHMTTIFTYSDLLITI